MTDDMEHLFICCLAICVCLWGGGGADGDSAQSLQYSAGTELVLNKHQLRNYVKKKKPKTQTQTKPNQREWELFQNTPPYSHAFLLAVPHSEISLHMPRTVRTVWVSHRQQCSVQASSPHNLLLFNLLVTCTVFNHGRQFTILSFIKL